VQLDDEVDDERATTGPAVGTVEIACYRRCISWRSRDSFPGG